MEYILVLCTINDLETAKGICTKLVKEKLAACGNIIPQISSIYFWENEIVEDDEYLMLLKTKSTLFDELKLRIAELHPYEVPEIISVKIDKGSKAYLDWISSSTKDLSI